MNSLQEDVKLAIRDVLDFPKEGIVFKDITPIMLDPVLSNRIVDFLAEKYSHEAIDKIAGVESRGFLFGYALAMKMNKPFILIRKKGKLPYKKISYKYDLEYGSAEIEMHVDALKKGERILIHDDLLATGGSASATAELIKKCGGEIAGFNFLVGLEFLEGRKKLSAYTENIYNLVTY